MIKRILIIIMLILMLLSQYSGLPAWRIMPTASLVYSETPIIASSPELYDNTGPASPTAKASPALPTQHGTPSSAPEAEMGSSIPSSIPAPVESPVHTIIPSPTPAPGSAASPAPPSYQPASTVLVPAPSPTPESAVSADKFTLNPSAAPGPLADKLPFFNAESKEAAAFFSDMKAIVDKAEKVSSICSIYGVFIMDLKTGFYYGINENLTRIDVADNVPEGYFNSASVIKLFQGYLFCDMIRNGELDAEKMWHDKVTGRKFRLMPMIKSMISYSDNNFSNACLRIVDNKTSNLVLNRIGIKNSRIYGEMSGAMGYSRQNNIEKYGTEKRCARITPRDAGLILYNIYKNKDTDYYMKALNEALLGNVYNTRIPVGVKRVSSKYPVAHKTGTNSSIGVYNDAGIVYTKNPFILVVFTQGTTSTAGHSFIRSLAEQLTRYFENR